MIDGIYKQYEPSFQGNVQQSWLALGTISVVVLAMTAMFQKRKDVI